MCWSQVNLAHLKTAKESFIVLSANCVCFSNLMAAPLFAFFLNKDFLQLRLIKHHWVYNFLHPNKTNDTNLSKAQYSNYGYICHNETIDTYNLLLYKEQNPQSDAHTSAFKKRCLKKKTTLIWAHNLPTCACSCRAFTILTMIRMNFIDHFAHIGSHRPLGNLQGWWLSW